MPLVETEYFIVELPDEWLAEQDEETVVITDPDDVSTIEITPLRKEQGEVEEADIQAFSAELREQGLVPTSKTVGDFWGEYYVYQDDEAAWREWFVAAEDVVLFITHGSELVHQGLDDAIVDDILSTLVYLHADEE